MVASKPELKDPDYYDKFVKLEKEEIDDDLKEIEQRLESRPCQNIPVSVSEDSKWELEINSVQNQTTENDCDQKLLNDLWSKNNDTQLTNLNESNEEEQNVSDINLNKEEEEEKPIESMAENSSGSLDESVELDDESVELDKEEEEKDRDVDKDEPNNSTEALLDEEDLAELRANDKIPFHKDPKVRLVVVIGLGVAVFTFLHFFLTTFTTLDYTFSLAEYQANQEENKRLQEGKKDPKDEIIEAKDLEIEKLKTKEIAQVQKAEIEKQDRVNKPKEADKPVQSQSAPAVKPQPQPVPRPVTYPPTRIARTPVATNVTQVAKVEKPKRSIDPEEKWRQAAALGTYGLGSGSSAFVTSRTTTRPTNPTTRQTVSPMPTQVAQTQLPTQPVAIPPVTSGVRVIGINSRVEAKLLDDFLLAPQSVAQIELKEDLLFTDGSTALPEETILLLEFDPENPPTATTIPVSKILLPVNGQYREIKAPQGALFVRGKDNKPLRFKTAGGNRGGLGIGDVVGVAGGVLDVPTEVTQTARRVTTGSQSSQAQSTTTILSKGASIEVYVYESFVLPGAIGF